MWTDFWGWLANLPPGSASFVGTLTGSSLGLLAILAGALFNAHLNRQRDNELRDAERVGLASALYAELKSIHRALVENSLYLKDTPPDREGGFMVPQLSRPILQELLPKIGLLRADTIRKVMDAYAMAEQYLEFFILHGGKLKTDMPGNRHLVYMDGQKMKLVIAVNEARAPVVQEAIDALAPYLK